MTTFHLVHSTPSTLALGELLVRHGATPAVGGDLIVIGPSSIEQAREQLAQLSEAERSRALVVGLSDALGTQRFPPPDSLAGALEEFEPLGMLVSAAKPWRPNAAGFIGKRSLAVAIGTTYLNLYATQHYAAYMSCCGDDAGAFVLRYLRAARAGSTLPSDAYVAYLTTKDRRTCAQSLDDALVAVGHADEAALWRAWCAGESVASHASGAWRDRTVHLGVSPPQGAAIGELWFDVCELSLMVHAGRAWLGTRPTARWQMRGFVDVAARASREVPVRPPYTVLDPERLLAGTDERTVKDLTFGEATLYAWWFGKTVPHLLDWQSAVEHLPSEQVKALWGRSEKEWTSTKLADNEAARVFVTPATVDVDPRKLAADDPRAASMIAGEYTHNWSIGFRTSVVVEEGLLDTVSSCHAPVEDVSLLSLLDRSAFR